MERPKNLFQFCDRNRFRMVLTFFEIKVSISKKLNMVKNAEFFIFPSCSCEALWLSNWVWEMWRKINWNFLSLPKIGLHRNSEVQERKENRVIYIRDGIWRFWEKSEKHIFWCRKRKILGNLTYLTKFLRSFWRFIRKNDVFKAWNHQFIGKRASHPLKV